MTPFNDSHSRVIDVGPRLLLRLVVLGIVGFVLIILLFASVAKVESGSVGVLTLFGRVTGEVLPEGIHLVNPFKENNQMSIRTQETKESASVPSSEGLVMNLDTSLIYHVNPDKAADVFQKIGPNYSDVLIEPNLRAAIREATRPIPPTRFTPASARWWPSRFTINWSACSASADSPWKAFCCAISSSPPR
jgi:hypothetical protein